jgi:hypothetical protein
LRCVPLAQLLPRIPGWLQGLHPWDCCRCSLLLLLLLLLRLLRLLLLV